MCATKSMPFAVSKDEWNTRKTLISPRRMHCTYCSMPKGTSQVEAILSSEKIKPIAEAVIELHLSVGIS